jgi:hypothetical protein
MHFIDEAGTAIVSLLGHGVGTLTNASRAEDGPPDRGLKVRGKSIISRHQRKSLAIKEKGCHRQPFLEPRTWYLEPALTA